MRPIVADDQAVSPVIGVFLMVAITVVLAAGVFYLVGQMGRQSAEPAPNLALSTDDGRQQVNVVRADAGLDWATDLAVSGTCDPLLNGAPYPTEPGIRVSAGDILSCESGEELVVTSSNGDGSALLYRNSFP